MVVRWTLVPVGAGDGVDVAVDVPRGTRLAELRGRLLAAVALPPDGGTALGVAGQVLTGDEVVGTAPLLDGAELRLSPGDGPDGPAPAPSAPLALVAVSGPGAGRVHPLPAGRVLLGRGAGCGITVADPDVSRRHCEVEVSPEGVRVRDLGSSNGTHVCPPRAPGGGQPLDVATGTSDGTRATVALGGHLRAGSSRFQLRLADAPPDRQRHEGRAEDRGDGDGTVPHVAGPAPALRDRGRTFSVPAPPPPRRRRRLPWLTALVPLALAVPVALWWGSPVVLLLGLAGPVLVVGSVVADRRDGGREAAAARAEHDEAVARARADAGRAAADVAEAMRAEHPDLATVLARARARSPELWRGDGSAGGAPAVRVGVADLPGPVRLDLPSAGMPGTGGAAPGAARGDRLVLRDVPLVADLGGGLEVRGPATWRAGTAAGVVGRLAAALGPGRMGVVVLAGRGAAGHWDWTRWLPHTEGRGPVPHAGAVGDLPAWRRVPLAGTAAGTAVPRRVLVVVDAPDEAGPAVPDLLLEGAAGGPPGGVAVDLLVLTAPGAAAAATCRSTAAAAGETGTRVTLSSPEGVHEGVAEPAGPWWTARLARALAPVRPAGAWAGAGAVPSDVRLQDLLVAVGSRDDRDDGRDGDHEADQDEAGLPRVGAGAVARWWRDGRGRAAARLALPLGAGEGGPVVVDLVRDGPHALVAGTTGAGKSELLRTLVLGLACRHPPDELAFLLVDFKGGAAFGDCADLPHTVGVLTDLDVHTARRVLSGLRAEIRRRERLLAERGAADLAAYAAVPGAHRLSRLVVAVDEFRVLAQDAPDVLDGLVHAAAVGRSLGIHLVLATQRPAGIVSPEIRANTALRIALRVQDASDSRDVVGTPDAAALPRGLPGRAVVSRDGSSEVVQVARAAAVGSGARVVLLSSDGTAGTEVPGDVPVPERPAGPAGTGAADLVAACREVAARLGVSAVAPWSPPLPDVVTGEEVAALDAPRAGDADPRLAFALADLPALGRRSALAWRPAGDGPLLVTGGPRSGRTGALASVLDAALAAGLPAVAVAGGTGGWPPGAVVVDRRDPDHVADVLEALAARAARPGDGWCALAVDDADVLVDDRGSGDATERLAALLRDATAARVAVAVAGGRAVMTGRWQAHSRLRVLLRPADPADAALVGVGPRDLPRRWPPGRGVVAREAVTGTTTAAAADAPAPPTPEGEDDVPGAVEVQVALPRRHGAAAPPRLPPPLPLPVALPRLVAAAALGAPSEPRAAASAPGPLPLGMGGDGSPVAVDPFEGPGVLVAGPAGSGRTSAVRALAAAAQAAGMPAVVVLTAARDEWQRPAAVHVVGSAGEAAAALEAPGRVLLLVDGLDLLPAAAEDLVLQAVADPEAGVVVTATSAHLAAQFRGYAALVRRHGSGLLLQPGRHDARDVLGAAGRAQRAAVPGRGVLISRGRGVRVQVAWTGGPCAGQAAAPSGGAGRQQPAEQPPSLPASPPPGGQGRAGGGPVGRPTPPGGPGRALPPAPRRPAATACPPPPPDPRHGPAPRRPDGSAR